MSEGKDASSSSTADVREESEGAGIEDQQMPVDDQGDLPQTHQEVAPPTESNSADKAEPVVRSNDIERDKGCMKGLTEKGVVRMLHNFWLLMVKLSFMWIFTVASLSYYGVVIINFFINYNLLFYPFFIDVKIKAKLSDI